MTSAERSPLSSPALVPAEVFGSGMLPSFGPAYYLLGMPFFFRNLRMEDHSVERVLRAAERGPVVYVLHTRSHVDWLALNRVLLDHRLPLPVLTNGLDATAWMPLAEMWRSVARKLRFPHRDSAGGWERDEPPPDPFVSGWLTRAVAAGRPACVFLAPPRDALVRAEPDPLPALLEAQALTDRPVQVVPVVVIWNRSPEPARTEVGRFLLGTEDNPGALGKLLALTTRSGDAIVQVGEPVALGELGERFREETPARRLKVLRLVLRRWLYREARVVKGPRSRPRGWVKRQVLEGREMAAVLEREALATGKPVEKLHKEASKIFDRIAARFSFPLVRVAAWLCRLIWNRIYSGIDMRPADVDRFREALRTGTPVIVPCHRSHLDYLLISSVLYEQDVVIPHVVAGDNLAFWPMGPLFRRVGAFFIRRSFAGDRLFPVVFARYLEALVRMEVPVEFFIEGGRSRTGKLLPAKLGVLGMVLDAAAAAREDREVTLLPVYIGYEQIAEERAYARELSGGHKKREDVGEVVKATRVLGRRFGKVYLRVGEPLAAREVLAGWGELSKAARHERLLSVGERILHRINEEALALPTAIVALAILAHPKRGIRHEELRARVVRLRSFLAAVGVQEAGGLDHVDGILEEALGRFTSGRLVKPLEEDGSRVYSIVPERRVTLDYYKNTLVHAFVPAAYLAAAVRAVGKDQVDREAVSRLFRLQQFLFRYEFILDPDADARELEERAIRALEAYGALRTEGPLVVADRGRVVEIANLLANILESYLLLLRTARTAGPTTAADLPLRALALGKTLLAVDELSRPEALNRVSLENAVRAFSEEGVLRGTGQLEYAADAGGAYTRDLGALLGVEA